MLVKFKNPFFTQGNWSDFDPFFGKDLMPAIKTVPAVNVKENKESFTLEMAAPGMKKEDFSLKIEGDMLGISSNKETVKNEDDEKFNRREYNFSAFKRSFSLPESVNINGISAEYADGILRVQLPKKEESKETGPKEITIS